MIIGIIMKLIMKIIIMIMIIMIFIIMIICYVADKYKAKLTGGWTQVEALPSTSSAIEKSYIIKVSLPIHYDKCCGF